MKLRPYTVIASEAKQSSIVPQNLTGLLRRLRLLAMTAETY
jgi:hypothetical protein